MTEQWQEDIQRPGSEGEEGLLISIEQFFKMTGILFMDEIAAPHQQSIHSSILCPSWRASVEGQIPLAEYMVAMTVNVPQLELYTYISKDLQEWIDHIQAIYQEAEEEALKMTPQLFQEFVLVDEIGQVELIHWLKLIKVHNHEQVKSEWYDWKLQWVKWLYEKASEGFEHLEKGEVNYLTAYGMVALISHSAELDNYCWEVKEANAKLGHFEEKLKEVQTEKNEISTSIEKTK
ncbi:Spc7 kinetochore protein domain-containing protein [Pisolithus marmoratus]|nr:Spc7 kinetochore protein domain-containing protein [Pisolithus marmoratus]